MYEKFDSVIGVTTCRSGNGTFVELDGGQTAWINRVCLPEGLNVICTVHGIKENGFPILNLDSVNYEDVA